jgi:hypothetical protein
MGAIFRFILWMVHGFFLYKMINPYYYFFSFSKQVSKLNFFFLNKNSFFFYITKFLSSHHKACFLLVLNYAFKNLFFISIKVGTSRRNIGFKSIFDLIKHKTIVPKNKISNLKRKKWNDHMLMPRFRFVLDLNIEMDFLLLQQDAITISNCPIIIVWWNRF